VFFFFFKGAMISVKCCVNVLCKLVISIDVKCNAN